MEWSTSNLIIFVTAWIISSAYAKEIDVNCYRNDHKMAFEQEITSAKKNAQVVGLVAKQLKEINHIYEKYRFKITDVSQQEGQLIEAVVETDHQTRRKVANSGEGYNCNADDLSDRKDLRDVVMSRPKLQNVSIVKNETVFEITCFRSKDMDRKKNWVLVYL